MRPGDIGLVPLPQVEIDRIEAQQRQRMDEDARRAAEEQRQRQLYIDAELKRLQEDAQMQASLEEARGQFRAQRLEHLARQRWRIEMNQGLLMQMMPFFEKWADTHEAPQILAMQRLLDIEDAESLDEVHNRQERVRGAMQGLIEDNLLAQAHAMAQCEDAIKRAADGSAQGWRARMEALEARKAHLLALIQWGPVKNPLLRATLSWWGLAGAMILAASVCGLILWNPQWVRGISVVLKGLLAVLTLQSLTGLMHQTVFRKALNFRARKRLIGLEEELLRVRDRAEQAVQKAAQLQAGAVLDQWRNSYETLCSLNYLKEWLDLRYVYAL